MACGFQVAIAILFMRLEGANSHSEFRAVCFYTIYIYIVLTSCLFLVLTLFIKVNLKNLNSTHIYVSLSHEVSTSLNQTMKLSILTFTLTLMAACGLAEPQEDRRCTALNCTYRKNPIFDNKPFLRPDRFSFPILFSFSFSQSNMIS